MADFPYSTNPASVKRFLGDIQRIGKPPKVTFKWIQGLGYKGRTLNITGVLKTLGFTDSSGVPTDLWTAYRGGRNRAVMATTLRQVYSGLFETYPDAYRKDDEALRNFFSSHTDVGEQAVTYMVRTFKTLVNLADFDSDVATVSDVVGVEAVAPPAQEIKPLPRLEVSVPKEVTINVNIQLQLPATQDETIYDKLFEALKKHILS